MVKERKKERKDDVAVTRMHMHIHTRPHSSILINMLRNGPTWYSKISRTSVNSFGLIVGPVADVSSAATKTACG